DDNAVWEPIPRDRDKVFVSYGGMVLGAARMALPSLVMFRARYPDPQALFANAGEFDRRALGTLDKSVWDSVATSLMQRIDDRVIDNAVAAMPPEYATGSRRIAATLKARRNGLPGAAARYSTKQRTVAAVQANGADDELHVTPEADG